MLLKIYIMCCTKLQLVDCKVDYKYLDDDLMLKNNFWNTFISHKESLLADSCFDYYKYGLCISCMISKSYVVVTFVASSYVSFSYALFSKYPLKIPATFSASSKADLKCAKSRFSFLIPVAIFF